MCGTLAQLVEQRTFNPLVTSSNLVRPTTLYNTLCPKAQGVFLWSGRGLLYLISQSEPAFFQCFELIAHSFQAASSLGNFCRGHGLR